MTTTSLYLTLTPKKRISVVKKMNIASFDIDAQYCFTPVCPNELPISGGDEIADELNEQAKYAGFRIGSKDAHPADALWVATEHNPQHTPISGPHVDVHWKAHAIPGSKGFQLLKGLPHPADYDYFVWKGVEPDMHPYGACYHDLTSKLSTGVIEYLRVHQVSTVIVGGLATDYCVKTTVLQLLEAHFKVIVNLSACRGIHEDTVESAINAMQQQGAIIVKHTDEIEAELL